MMFFFQLSQRDRKIALAIISLSTTLLAAISFQTAIAQQVQNWTTYEDPILGIQIKYPSWWEKIQEGDSIGFYDIPMMASVNYFLLPKEMNTLDKFMRQMMTQLRSPSEENISVNKTSTIGMDDIPAYRVEWNNVPDTGVQTKRIYYFSIDNSTGTGYMISFTTPLENSQEDVPLFERVVKSFKFLS